MLQDFKNLQVLPRAMWILCGTIVVNRIGTMVIPLLSLYVTGGLHLPAATAGLLMSMYGATALVIAPLAGRISDRVGYARTMRASLFASGLVLLMFPFATSLPAMMVAVVLLGVTTEAYRPASSAVVSRMVPASQRRMAVSLVRLAVNLGMSVGPLIGGMLAAWSFDAVFIVDGLTTLVAAVSLTLFFNPTLVEEPEHEQTSATPQQDRADVGAFAWFLAAVVLVAAVFFQLDAAVPLFVTRDLALPISAYGLMFTVNTLIIVVIEVPLNVRTSLWPARHTLSLGVFLIGAGFGGMALVESIPSLLVTVVLWTFGEMLLFPGAQAYVAELAPPSRRGAWMGVFMMAFNLGFAIGPLSGAALMDAYGSKVLWICLLYTSDAADE